MATENVLIEFTVDYSQLTSAQAELAKTGKIDQKGFDAIQASINETATDTKGLIKTFKDVASASVKMGKTVEDAFGAGVQDALDQAGVSAEEFAGALKKANQPASTLKKELQQLKESMARMKAEGKDTGKEFDALRQRAGKLSDAIADANAEIKNAGSDTRGLDNVVGTISALAGGYAAVQGAVGLFGEENEDLQKSLLKVNSAMALATGVQQFYNATLKEGSLARLADSVVTGTQTAATTLLTYVTGGATAAARAYRIALLATGIGAIVILVLSLVAALDSQKESMEDVNNEIERQNGLLEQSNKLITRQAEIREAQAQAAGKAESDLIRIRGQALVDQYNNITLINKGLAIQRDATKATSEAWFAYNKQIEDNKELQEDIAQQIQLINIRGGAQVKKELQERAKAQEELNKKTDEAIKKATAAELAELDKRVKAQLAALDKEEEQSRIHFENEQDILEQARAEREAINKKWDDLRLQQMDFLARSSQIAADKAKAAEEAIMRKRIDNLNQAITIGNQVSGIYRQLADAQTARDNAAIESQRRRIQAELEAGVLSQKEFAARNKVIDKLARDAQTKAAQREKAAALFSAALAIPKAFLQGLQQGGLKLAVVYAALAAVEAALIASKPIPKFFKGKKDRYEGPGIVGDMGTELVEQNGRMFLYTKPTQTYLSANDKVYTAAETRQIMHNTNISTTVKQNPQPVFDYGKFAAAIPKDGVNINIDKDFISVAVANGLQRTNYMDRRYSSKK